MVQIKDGQIVRDSESDAIDENSGSNTVVVAGYPLSKYSLVGIALLAFMFGGVPGLVVSGGFIGAGYLYSNAGATRGRASLLPTTQRSGAPGGVRNVKTIGDLPKPVKC